MTTRTISLIFGIVFTAIALLGFVPAATPAPPPGAPDLAVDAGYGYLLGLFPVNVLHNVVHLVFGVWGLLAYRSFSAGRMYLRSVAVIYGVLVLFGLIPLLRTTFGLIPIFGHDVWLHLVIAAVAGFFGWKSETAPTTAVPPPA